MFGVDANNPGNHNRENWYAWVQRPCIELIPEKGAALAGEINLDNLLRSMSPRLIEGEYVFCTLKDSSYGDIAAVRPIASFIEDEGLSLVVLKQAADKFNMPYAGVFRCITLGVHSSLEAVGLTAAVAGTLAEQGIAANVIAAYFHDHVFVQSDLAERAIGILSRYNT
jgi:hypothetical protein